ncbi:MAG: hypothetical protein WEG56_13785 [Chloroflexota bacterium]
MSDDPTRPSAETWTPSRGGRIAIGLLVGFGAVGIGAGLGLIGTFLDVDLPFFDPSAMIMMAPVIIVPGFAGAVLRERDAVAAITAGAVASPIVAIFAVDGSCQKNLWAAVGLAAITAYVLVIAGVVAFVGAWIGRASTVRYQPRRDVIALVVVGAIGIVAWITAVAMLFGCP